MRGWAGWNFVTADNPHPSAGEVPDANYVVVAPDYFRTLQIPLRQRVPELLLPPRIGDIDLRLVERDADDFQACNRPDRDKRPMMSGR